MLTTMHMMHPPTQRYFLLFTVILLITSCGKFNYGPFLSNAPNLELNKHNLIKIEARSELFKDDFKVAVLSDTHNYYSELNKAIKKINSKKKEIAFVIVTGDVTNLGLLEEYKLTVKFLKRLSIPFLVIIGNHDYLTNGNKIFKKIFGKKNISFQFKGSKFLLLDNNNWETGYRFPGFVWMTEELMISRATINMVFSHVPPNDRDRFSEEFINEISNVLMYSNVKYYVNGHNHGPGDNFFGGANHITVGSVSKNVYLELKFSSEGVTHERVRF